MEKLVLTPTETGYSVRESIAPFLYQELEGGSPRQRLDMIDGVSKIANVQWICGPKDYEYLINFEKEHIRLNCESFPIDLILYSGDLEELSAVIIPDTFKLVSKRGLTYTVQAQLELTPLNETNIVLANNVLLYLPFDVDYLDKSPIANEFSWHIEAGTTPPAYNASTAPYTEIKSNKAIFGVGGLLVNNEMGRVPTYANSDELLLDGDFTIQGFCSFALLPDITRTLYSWYSGSDGPWVETQQLACSMGNNNYNPPKSFTFKGGLGTGLTPGCYDQSNSYYLNPYSKTETVSNVTRNCWIASDAIRNSGESPDLINIGSWHIELRKGQTNTTSFEFCVNDSVLGKKVYRVNTGFATGAHYAVIRKNGIIKFYCNGVCPYNTTDPSNAFGSMLAYSGPIGGVYPISIGGKRWTGPANDVLHHGSIFPSIDDVRITRVAEHTSNFTVPITALGATVVI
jgi:hypothetical protein